MLTVEIDVATNLPVARKVAELYEGDNAVAAVIHHVVEFEGQWRPLGNIKFDIERKCSPTHANVCGKTLTMAATATTLFPRDTYTIHFTIGIHGFEAPFEDAEI